VKEDFPKRKADGGALAATDGGGRVDSAEGVAGEKPGTVSASGRPHTLIALVNNKPDEVVIAALKRLLARAREGEIVSFAVALELTGRRMATTFVRGAGCEVYRLAGAVQYVLHRLNVCVDNSPDD
jgi:hypothetical protein